MEASQLIQEVYYAYRGKGASKTPVWGSEKANTALAIANRKQREWATDSNQSWASLFEIRDLATLAVPAISTAILTYDLPTDFMTPSDYIIVERLVGDSIQVGITSPKERDFNLDKVYISGRSPKKVTFNSIEDSFDGGALKAPGYYIPTDMSTTTSKVAVDDPNWLVYATAAELARNDAAKDDQVANLMGMANDLYRKMVNANNELGFLQGKTVPTNIPQISPDLEEDWTI